MLGNNLKSWIVTEISFEVNLKIQIKKYKIASFFLMATLNTNNELNSAVRPRRFFIKQQKRINNGGELTALTDSTELKTQNSKIW